MQIGDNYDLRYFQRYTLYFCSNNAKSMELQTGEFPGWDRSPVASMRTCVVFQSATIAATVNLFETNEYIDDEDDDDAVAAAVTDDDDDVDDYNVHCERHLLFILLYVPGWSVCI